MKFHPGDFVKMRQGSFRYGDHLGMVLRTGGRWFRRGMVLVESPPNPSRYPECHRHWMPVGALEIALSPEDERLVNGLLGGVE